ncbi:hypothetical protein MAR_014148 [Mya arenaria]|uniref:Uncharacterized protein n=1 Tax=Mya arenaria TaxID=6604 RepID=A0ABY7G549_MYAAR|nr:hypothetical protein MAR_014148 [Mya arenaria]
MEDILSELPETEVVGDVGRNPIQRAAQGKKCQEIVDAKSEIIKEIQRASQGEKCQEITDSESPWCILL